MRQEDIFRLDNEGGPLPYYRTSKNSDQHRREVSTLAQDHSKPMLSVLNDSEYSLKEEE